MSVSWTWQRYTYEATSDVQTHELHHWRRRHLFLLYHPQWLPHLPFLPRLHWHCPPLFSYPRLVLRTLLLPPLPLHVWILRHLFPNPNSISIESSLFPLGISPSPKQPSPDASLKLYAAKIQTTTPPRSAMPIYHQCRLTHPCVTHMTFTKPPCNPNHFVIFKSVFSQRLPLLTRVPLSGPWTLQWSVATSARRTHGQRRWIELQRCRFKFGLSAVWHVGITCTNLVGGGGVEFSIWIV